MRHGLVALALALTVGWWIIMSDDPLSDTSSVFSGPFQSRSGCEQTAKFLNDHFSEYFECVYQNHSIY